MSLSLTPVIFVTPSDTINKFDLDTPVESSVANGWLLCSTILSLNVNALIPPSTFLEKKVYKNFIY